MSPKTRSNPRPPKNRRSPRARRRYSPGRAGRPRICILCEGRVTEPGYFGSLKRELSLANVTIQHAPLKDMKSRVDALVSEDPGLDEIWCVLDEDERDEVTAFLQLLAARPARRPQGPRIASALSVPCFEYWFLLHFKFITKAFRASEGGKSACKQIIRHLRSYLPDYDKSNPRTWQECHRRRDTAIRNAKRAIGGQNASSTGVWRLVERLTLMSSADSP